MELREAVLVDTAEGALVHDDVKDGSSVRRGRPSAHPKFDRWHRRRGLLGSSARFGESAVVLLGDRCLDSACLDAEAHSALVSTATACTERVT